MSGFLARFLGQAYKPEGFLKQVSANTPEGFLQLSKKCMQQSQRMTMRSGSTTSPKIYHEQCKYLAYKLKFAVDGAQVFLLKFRSWPSLEVKDSNNFLEVLRFLYASSSIVEDFIRRCCQDAWIQTAMLLANISNHISSIGFNLEILALLFFGELTKNSQKSRITDIGAILKKIDDVYGAEVQTIEKKASKDVEVWSRNAIELLKNKKATSADCRLASLLLERHVHALREQHMPYEGGALLDLFQVDKENLKQMGQLGKGAFATVYKALWFGVDAAKKTFYVRDSPDFEKEISILQRLSHPNITSLLGYTKEDRECSIIVELMDEDLFNLIQRKMKERNTDDFPFDLWESVELMLQIGGGMQYLHEMRIVHRDLKSLNILVRYVKGRNSEIAHVLAKVSDFGLSKTKESSLTYGSQTPNMGTARWMAPEMIKLFMDGRQIEISNVDPKAKKQPFGGDVYSFAMICYEILTGEIPYFEERSLNEVKKKVLKGDRPQLPDRCPENLKSLIERCWNPNASHRPSFAEICTELRYVKCLLLKSCMTSLQVESFSQIQSSRETGSFGEGKSSIGVENSSQVNILGSRMNLDLQPGISSEIRKFTIVDLKQITLNFSKSHKIGEGNCGIVYQGKIEDGTMVAIKRAKKEARVLEEFRTEIGVLSQVQHINLVRLVGFLEEENEQIIVTKYVTNGNLRQHLDGEPYGVILDMNKRLNIAIDVATALTYLHYHTDKTIIHRDVKSSNILITNTFRAKVGDFGLSLAQLRIEEPLYISMPVLGTAGYIDPEYLTTGQLNVKSDVYSFGVLLVELFTGRHPLELERPRSERVTVRWAFKDFVEGRLKNIIDPKMQLSLADLEILERIFELAFACLAPTKVDRPAMSNAEKILWTIRKDFQFSLRKQLAESLEAENPNFDDSS